MCTERRGHSPAVAFSGPPDRRCVRRFSGGVGWVPRLVERIQQGRTVLPHLLPERLRVRRDVDAPAPYLAWGAVKVFDTVACPAKPGIPSGVAVDDAVTIGLYTQGMALAPMLLERSGKLTEDSP